MLQSTWNGRNAEEARAASPPPFSRAFGSPSMALADPIAVVAEAVRGVLAERNAGARPSARDRGAAPIFADRLFALRHAETLAPGVREVRIAPGTVVTPLARDLMKRLGVAIQPVGLADLGAAVGGEWAFAIDADLGALHVLRRSLLEDAGRWRELGPSIAEASAWIQSGEGRGVLFITTEAAAAVWLACQAPGVRAAAVADPDDVQRASRSIGANLIVVEPAGKSPSWIVRLASAFRQSGAPRFIDPPLRLKEARR